MGAWSAAGIFGPVLVNDLREYQRAQGVAHAQAYSVTLYLLSGLLLIGVAGIVQDGTRAWQVVLAWAAVSRPMAWGMGVTLDKALWLFR